MKDIDHNNLHPVEYHPNALSHNRSAIDAWVSQGIVIDGMRYLICELFVRNGMLWTILHNDGKFYEFQLQSAGGGSFDDTQIVRRLDALEARDQRYDDTGIKQRVKNLEDTKYDDTVLINRVSLLEKNMGKSAYQIWLDHGHTGSEQDFLNSLVGPRGPKGEKGDVTDIGIVALRKYYATMTNPDIPLNSENSEYRCLTWNSKSQLGTLHLDIVPTKQIGRGVQIGTLSSTDPLPVTLIETAVTSDDSDGIGQIYVTTDGRILCNNLKAHTRYTVDLIGYYNTKG